MEHRSPLAADGRRSELGATAVEYVFLVVAIALIMMIGAFLLGGALQSRFASAATCVDTVSSGTSNC